MTIPTSRPSTPDVTALTNVPLTTSSGEKLPEVRFSRRIPADVVHGPKPRNESVGRTARDWQKQMQFSSPPGNFPSVLATSLRELSEMAVVRCNRDGAPTDEQQAQLELVQGKYQTLNVQQRQRLARSNPQASEELRARPREQQRHLAQSVLAAYSGKTNVPGFCSENRNLLHALLMKNGTPSRELIPVTLCGERDNGAEFNHAVLLHWPRGLGPDGHLLSGDELINLLAAHVDEITFLDPWHRHGRKICTFPRGSTIDNLLDHCVRAMLVAKDFNPETLRWGESGPRSRATPAFIFARQTAPTT